MKAPYRPITTTDADILRVARDGGDIVAAWERLCVCGHQRHSHYAETGQQGSFGGSACQECWTCGSFREDT